MIMAERGPYIEGFAQRSGNITVELGLIEARIARVQAGSKFRLRFGGDIVDRPAGRVLAEQSPLRALEDLDPFQVQANAGGHDRIGNPDLVLIDADRR